MKKLLLVIAALSLVLAGCQKQEDTTTPVGDAASTPVTDVSATPVVGDAATTTP